MFQVEPEYFAHKLRLKLVDEAGNHVQAAPPEVRIGGIQADNAQAVWATGVAGLAVISALTESDDPELTARALLAGRST